MLTPKQLYKSYSISPCASYLESPYSQLNSYEVFDITGGATAAGTPINWSRIISFFKNVKYPCYASAPFVGSIAKTGQNKLGLTFRFLQEIDVEAYKEQQPTVRAGTAYSVRNCCDITRACYYQANNLIDRWFARMATEYLEYFAHNSLPDCLMMCGPDLVHEVAAEYYRAPGYTVTPNEPYVRSGASYYDKDGSILKSFAAQEQQILGMFCFPPTTKGVAGAAHSCVEYTDEGTGQATSYCESCGECELDPNTGAPKDPDAPCCNKGTIYYYNECCGSKLTNREKDFSLWVKSDDGSFNGTISGGRIGEELKHVGIMERKLYGGFANFISQGSGSDPPICLEDVFLSECRKFNNWDYTNNTLRKDANGDIFPYYMYYSIERARTISLLMKATAGRNANVTTDTKWMVDRVKDLLWNGYGVMLLTNVGFKEFRDSRGLSYPDRIFYHTYNIIGYDDTKREFNECVYLLQCPMGEWIRGGSPSWGPLPTGSFLVTESYLRCIINYYPGADFYNCRKKPCTGSCLDSEEEQRKAQGCGPGYEGKCDPFYCTPQQRSCGLLFAMSLVEGFPRQNLNHSKFYPVRDMKQKNKEQVLKVLENGL